MPGYDTDTPGRFEECPHPYDHEIRLDLNNILRGVVWFMLADGETRGVVRLVDGSWWWAFGEIVSEAFTTWADAVDDLQRYLLVNHRTLLRRWGY